MKASEDASVHVDAIVLRLFLTLAGSSRQSIPAHRDGTGKRHPD